MKIKARFAVLVLGILCSQLAWGAYNMPEGVTPLSHDIHDLHMIVFWFMVAIGVVVFGVMFYSIIVHRKSRGHQAAQFHEHTTIEILWAVIPLILLIGMAIPASKVLFRMEDSSEAEVNVKVIGYQWKWQYEYLDEGISYFSNLKTSQDEIHNHASKSENYLLDVDHPLVLPVGTKVRFLITSNDVNHAWWVPELGIKKDAIPGYLREAWAVIEKPGIYRGQCAELCGTNHGFMPIVVMAVTREDFKNWVAAKKSGKDLALNTKPHTYNKDELMANGKKVYEATCSVCHQINGEGMLPMFAAIKGSPVAKGPVEAHINIVLNGKTGTSMQAFSRQLNDDEIAAVVTYERNAFGNNTNDLVQPEQVKKLREGIKK
jgi:cytochrome c oxidase subunit II